MFSLDGLPALLSAPFDEIIDVRSPAEFAEDHLPGAVSLPVMSNEERARVGTIYVQEEPFKARKIGAAIVARNAARHLETSLSDKPGSYRPLVYCWRGGQRSGAFATILKAIGWRVETLEGGYRTYRRLVVDALYGKEFPAPVIQLAGQTGTGKTAILHRLAALGIQTIDLEGLARHKGSLFGAMGPQPSQKAFESALALAALRLDPARPVVVESESASIGAVNLPPGLWKAMKTGRAIEITAPIAARAAFCARDYAEVTADPARLSAILDRLRPYQSKDDIARWQSMAAGREYESLAAALMEAHYDKRYKLPENLPLIGRVALQDLSGEDLDRAAAQVASYVPGSSRAA